MSKFIFVTFPNEAKAYEGTRSLGELHDEGSLTLYGVAVVARAPDGKLSVKRDTEHGPLGVVIGSLVGGMIGLLGGPVGAAIGVGSGALLGMMGDLTNLGVSGEFLEKVSQSLTPGKVAVIAEVSEDWVTPLDSRMSALGGIVHRVGRSDVEEQQAKTQMSAMKADLAHLKVEYGHAKAETKAAVRVRMDEVETEAQAISDRLTTRVKQFKQETDAKLSTLEAQAAKVKSDAKAKFHGRITELKADDKRRSEELKQAWGLTKEALAS